MMKHLITELPFEFEQLQKALDRLTDWDIVQLIPMMRITGKLAIPGTQRQEPYFIGVFTKRNVKQIGLNT